MRAFPGRNKKNSRHGRFSCLARGREREWTDCQRPHFMKLLLTLLVAGGLSLAHAQVSTWPQTAASSAGEVTVYQPQIESFSGNQFNAHSAVSVAQGSGEPLFGAIFFTAQVATDRDTGMVTVQSIDVTKCVFPSVDSATADTVSQAIDAAAGEWNLTLSESQLLAQLALTQQQQAAAANLNNTPPNIIFETRPSVLVTIAGEPKLVQAPGSDIMTVVNTPFFIALDPATKTYYLRGGGQWLSSSDVLNGPWTVTTDVPEAVSALASNHQDPSTDDTSTSGEPPLVIVATQPTELIQTTGPAEYGPIDGTNLLYVTNTDSDVFMDIDTQTLFVLLSGRWYTAPSQSGPWTYVAPKALPADFAKIPLGSPKAGVLASVAGTELAKNAALNAMVPQTAAIQRSAAGPNVSYDGDPKFEPVEKGSSVRYAANTTHAVVAVDDTYYVCSDGVWFEGPAPVGPWTVSVEIPEVIYTIPPTCPIYPVTFCNIYSYTPNVVYCGYLPGYTGSYIYDGAIVFGTGWTYDPWFGTYFIPRPVTWGFGASFNLAWGTWGFALGGGWGIGSFACSWNSGWWGWENYSWSNWNWNPSWNENVNITRNINRTVINKNIYRNHPDRLTPRERQRLEDNENRLARQERHDENQIQRDRGNPADRAQRQEDRQQEQHDENRINRDQNRLDRNNVYADGEGNVYRHDGNGWQHRQDGEWRHADGEAFRRHREELNRYFGARARGGFHPHHFGGGGHHGRGGGHRR